MLIRGESDASRLSCLIAHVFADLEPPCGRCRGGGLALNQKTNIFPLRNGIDFLGFRTYMTDTGKVIRKIRRKSKNNMRRKLSKMAKLHKSGQIEIEAVNQSYQSWRAHAAKGNCYYLIQSMDQHFGNLYLGGRKWQKH